MPNCPAGSTLPSSALTILFISPTEIGRKSKVGKDQEEIICLATCFVEKPSAG
jgi:hypothetical protein